jgi:hypothetical protein
MSTPTTDDWDTLARTWQLTPAQSRRGARDPLTLHRHVARRTRLLILTVVLEAILTVAVITWVWARLPDDTSYARVWRIGAMVFSAAVWAYCLWNRRHSWRPYGADTAAFLKLSRERLEAGRRSVRVVRLVLGAALLVGVPWLALRVSRGFVSPEEGVVWIFFGSYAVCGLGACVWYLRWIAAESRTLDALDDGQT